MPSLEDAAGSPVAADEASADNNGSRYFVGGVALQRPALSGMGDHVLAGFGSHSDLWNCTGYLVSVSNTPGAGVAAI